MKQSRRQATRQKTTLNDNLMSIESAKPQIEASKDKTIVLDPEVKNVSELAAKVKMSEETR